MHSGGAAYVQCGLPDLALEPGVGLCCCRLCCSSPSDRSARLCGRVSLSAISYRAYRRHGMAILLGPLQLPFNVIWEPKTRTHLYVTRVVWNENVMADTDRCDVAERQPLEPPEGLNPVVIHLGHGHTKCMTMAKWAGRSGRNGTIRTARKCLKILVLSKQVE